MRHEGLAEIGFQGGAGLRDVWKHKDLGHTAGVFTDTVPGHGVTLLIVSRLLGLISRDPGPPEQERIGIGRLPILLGTSRADAVAGVVVDA